jgi:hypothetical protein
MPSAETVLHLALCGVKPAEPLSSRSVRPACIADLSGYPPRAPQARRIAREAAIAAQFCDVRRFPAALP